MKRTPLTRKTPVKKRNAKRKASEWARAYGSQERVEWVRPNGAFDIPNGVTYDVA